jgi:DNA mismatch repair protein MSH5
MYPQSYSPGSRMDEDAGDEEDEEDEDASEAGRGWNGLQEGVTLAVTAVKGRVACCCYDGRDGKLYFLEDQEDSTSWDLAAMGTSLPLPSQPSTHVLHSQ